MRGLHAGEVHEAPRGRPRPPGVGPERGRGVRRSAEFVPSVHAVSSVRIRESRADLRFGGAEGIRTPDLLIANETRYQLRHSPKRWETLAPGSRVARNRVGSGADGAVPAALASRFGAWRLRRPRGPAGSRRRCGRRSRRRWSRGRWCGRCAGAAGLATYVGRVTGTGPTGCGSVTAGIWPVSASSASSRPRSRRRGGRRRRRRRRSSRRPAPGRLGAHACSRRTISRQATSQATSRPAGMAAYQ